VSDNPGSGVAFERWSASGPLSGPAVLVLVNFTGSEVVNDMRVERDGDFFIVPNFRILQI